MSLTFPSGLSQPNIFLADFFLLISFTRVVFATQIETDDIRKTSELTGTMQRYSLMTPLHSRLKLILRQKHQKLYTRILNIAFLRNFWRYDKNVTVRWIFWHMLSLRATLKHIHFNINIKVLVCVSRRKKKQKTKNTSTLLFPFNLIIIPCSFLFFYMPVWSIRKKCHVPDKCTFIIVQYYCIHRSSLMKLFIYECRLCFWCFII